MTIGLYAICVVFAIKTTLRLPQWLLKCIAVACTAVALGQLDSSGIDPHVGAWICAVLSLTIVSVFLIDGLLWLPFAAMRLVIGLVAPSRWMT